MTRPAARLPLPHILREYALVADSERGALIGPRGELVWLCAPTWHDPAVFSALIGGRGHFTVAPSDEWFVWGGYYEARSLVFRSRYVLSSGVVECREALAWPGDRRRAVVLRRFFSIDTPVRVKVELNPRANFGRLPLSRLSCDKGVWTGRTGKLNVRFVGAPDARHDDELGLCAEIRLKAGEQHDFVLELSEDELGPELPDADRLWEATTNSWSTAAVDCSSSIAPRDAEHALAILHGLTRPGGGMVAAATMSLPERAEAGRNYDYRYCWIRDQCYAGLAAASIGDWSLLDDAVAFVAARLHDEGAALSPAYTIDGARVPDEQTLRGLKGYPGGGDKSGNWVNRQFQLDAFGNCLELFAAAARADRLTNEGRQAVDVAIAAIRARWTEADAGIWELSSDWWAQSRLECVAGLRSVAAPDLALDAGAAAECEALADRILTEVGRRCAHPSGRWQRAPGDEKVDASLLLAPVRGAIPAGDPRSVATLRAVEADLGRDGYVYRFRQDPQALHRSEGAFLLCGFMMSLATLQQGDLAAAGRWFERNRAACGPPGLLSEEYDVQQRQLRGNLPQAFVHAILLESSVALGRGSV